MYLFYRLVRASPFLVMGGGSTMYLQTQLDPEASGHCSFSWVSGSWLGENFHFTGHTLVSCLFLFSFSLFSFFSYSPLAIILPLYCIYTHHSLALELGPISHSHSKSPHSHPSTLLPFPYPSRPSTKSHCIPLPVTTRAHLHCFHTLLFFDTTRPDNIH